MWFFDEKPKVGAKCTACYDFQAKSCVGFCI